MTDLPRILISVIICTKDRPKELAICLKFLSHQLDLPEEVLVIDGSEWSYDEVETVVNSFSQSPLTIRYIRTKAGLTRQRNIGIVEACGTHLVFTDDDCELEPEALRNFSRVYLEEVSNTGIVTGSVIDPRLESSPVAQLGLWAVEQLLCKPFFLQRRGHGRYLASGAPTFYMGKHRSKVEVCCGFCCVPKPVAEKFLFDETLLKYCYCEDDDFAKRVSILYQNWFEPTAIAVHRKSPGARLPGYALGRSYVAHCQYLLNKNFPNRIANKVAFQMFLIGTPLLSLAKGQFGRSLGEMRGVTDVIGCFLRRVVTYVRSWILFRCYGPTKTYWDNKVEQSIRTYGGIKEEFGALRLVCKKLNIRTVLDLGFGSGRLAELYAELGLVVTAIDISTKALAQARNSWGELLYRVAAQLEHLPLSREFKVDLVVSTSTLQHIPPSVCEIVLEDVSKRTRAIFLKEFIDQCSSSQNGLFSHSYAAILGRFGFHESYRCFLGKNVAILFEKV